MTKDQLDAIEELKTTLARCEAEGLMIVTGCGEHGTDAVVGDYGELDGNGFFEFEVRSDASDHAIKQSDTRQFFVGCLFMDRC